MNKLLFSVLMGGRALFMADDGILPNGQENAPVVEEIKEDDSVNNNINFSEIVDEGKEIIDKLEKEDVEGLKVSITDYLSKYLEKDLVTKVVSWLFDGSIGVALLVIYKRYRKYKDMTASEIVGEFNNKSKEFIKDAVDKFSKEKIDKLVKVVDDLQKSNETMMKVLIMMQDNTAKGKIALIDFLGSKTDSEEVKEAVNEVSNILEEQEKVEKEVKDKVANDYENIF